ncbi:(2Fe-2S)-binding protein [Mesotoga sp. Brook.08.YT.4.2.5.1]|jgi:carbon-monoxide dehydrogenase small subunit|uniref:(2Fe-2S)-binding protein n=1 Tax=unclassified Mesotoga TaxID=1184398 RepID=UPI000B0E0489|nr:MULTISPECIES: (2Fe-2S)-binding protein [unclassified Mesotoga]PNQ05771.1 (2Fe-2S)-binding protein [Mesotoga sp. SC_NapDC3]PXF34985.1 (2Fe-2S)-binding protein [Mesotoga sp. SC_NapDC]RAM60508.1 (2Fe-2S)-binding protein [Mesotoga sp. SC_4PWA21]RAM60953.1 (2Fe-2S)-binding protein [Mesotoga sp. SC_3PWM13N19]RIZ61289.1 (2Fe-2S)-binding protein [Mesotoga sp. SC_NapDC2]
MRIAFTVNGRLHELDIDPGEYLLEVLRRIGYKSVRRSCNSASCGTCTVLLNGKPILSCSTFAVSIDGQNIETVEGMADGDKLHPIQEAILEEGGAQCGYCIPGVVMTGEALLRENPDPSDEEIRLALNGNICRCTGYEPQNRAIKKAAQVMRGEIDE